MKRKNTYIKNIFFSFLPAILAYLGKSNNILDHMLKEGIIGAGVDINLIKETSLVISIVLTFLLITLNLSKSEIGKSNYLKQRDNLLELNKLIFDSGLAKELNNDNLNLDMRIFVPKSTIADKVINIFNKKAKKEFIIRNLKSLAKVGMTEGLKFEVYPNPQGLVGECYTTQYMVYDTDLKNTNSTKYNLKKDQINKTDDLKFCLCCPIFNTKEEIIAIVAFDSKHEININNNLKDKLRSSITVFTQSLYEYIPEIFKPKGGLL